MQAKESNPRSLIFPFCRGLVYHVTEVQKASSVCQHRLGNEISIVPKNTGRKLRHQEVNVQLDLSHAGRLWHCQEYNSDFTVPSLVT